VSTALIRFSLYLALVTGAFLFALPFLFMMRTSIMPPWQVYIFPPEWIPAELHFEGWLKPWRLMPFGRFYLNTTYFAVLGTLGTLASTTIAAFAFARLRFEGRDVLFTIVLSTMMLPPQVSLIPQYVIFSRLHWTDSFRPLIVPQWLGVSAFNIFLLRQYYMTLSPELDDAARIDGCSLLGIFWRIILPLSAPALGAISIMHFTWSWNNFMGPLIYLNSRENFTISLALRFFQNQMSGVEMEALMAATITAMIPMLVVFFVAQKYFVQGIVITGVKG
jgi:ABC-type glycerol-3-phosphate transport system permease component